MTNPPVPATPLDVEAPDPPKLESRADLHRTATQPEKEGLAAGSGTPLDVEACVRLLREAADLFAERARSAEPWEAAAYNLKSATMNVLALALPGMGKDSELLDWLERTRAEVVCGTDDALRGWYVMGIDGIPIPNDGRLFASVREAIGAARAAQPQETSADA